MSLTRKFLSALGIEADKVDEIIEAHTSTVNGLKDEIAKYKEDAEKLPAVQDELDKANKTLEEKSDDAFETKYNDIKKQFDDYKKEQQAKEIKEKIKVAYSGLLKETGIDDKYINTVLKVTSLDDMKLLEDGKIDGADALKGSIKTDWADFIVDEGKRGIDTPNPIKKGGKEVDLGTLSMADYIAARKK